MPPVRYQDGRQRRDRDGSALVPPESMNQRRSHDFVSDQLPEGQRFHILAIVDGCRTSASAKCPDTSLSHRRVVRELDHTSPQASHRQRSSGGNDTELTSNAIPRMTLPALAGIASPRASRSRPPFESFNSRLRDGLLTRCPLRSMPHAQAMLEARRHVLKGAGDDGRGDNRTDPI